jgi:hypothetical protein
MLSKVNRKHLVDLLTFEDGSLSAVALDAIMARTIAKIFVVIFINMSYCRICFWDIADLDFDL